MSKQTLIKQIFSASCGANDVTNFYSVFRICWPVLNNQFHLFDIFETYMKTVESKTSKELDISLFNDFITSMASKKYPTATDSLNNLLLDFSRARGTRTSFSHTITTILEASILEEYSRYEVLLRSIFCQYCGKIARLTTRISWKEVTQHSLGMDRPAFLAFTIDYKISESNTLRAEADSLFRNVLSSFPIVSDVPNTTTTVLFPQFQILLLQLISKSYERIADQSSSNTFAKKLVSQEKNSFKEYLQSFLDSMDSHFHGEDLNIIEDVESPNVLGTEKDSGEESEVQDVSISKQFDAVLNPAYERPSDSFLGRPNHPREAFLLKVDLNFDRVSNIIKKDPLYRKCLDEANAVLLESEGQGNQSLMSNPVAIFDVVQYPSNLPEEVEVTLENSWSCCSLGKYKEALEYLEVARIQSVQKDEFVTSPKSQDNSLHFYILMSKGNIYQACGDDDQALSEYITCLTKAVEEAYYDWVHIAFNSIGIIAYYHLRFDIALCCFAIVMNFREKAYGPYSVDFATALNNYGASFFCVGKGKDARTMFERSWSICCSSVGQRSLRAAAIHKNLEKTKRFHLPTAKGLQTIVRSESAMYLKGGEFTIKALPPPSKTKAKRNIKSKKAKGV